MKKKIFVAVVTVVISATVIVVLSSFTSKAENAIEKVEATEHTHVPCCGKHCTYSVGCGCPGFSPKTNGKEWEKSYCKHCGHHKKYHK